MEVNISDLTWDRFIYPRGSKSDKTISSYVEALEIGAQFPPIRIQRVFNYADGNETIVLPAGRHEATVIVDGIHRWFAFKEKGIKKIAAVEWRNKPLDYEKNKTALLLESAKCNTSHCDRLSPGDRKANRPGYSRFRSGPPAIALAQRIQTDRPMLSLRRGGRECKWTESALAEKLGVIQQTVNTWISDIRARQRAGREIIIIRLNRLGRAQEQIAEIVGISQGRVAQIINNTNFGEINNLLTQGRNLGGRTSHYKLLMDIRNWSDLKTKLKQEGSEVYEKIVQLKMTAPGSMGHPSYIDISNTIYSIDRNAK